MNDTPDNISLAMIAAERIVRRVQTHPASTLAGAAGVGFILARGVPNVLLRAGATFALRAVTAQVMDNLMPASDVDAPVRTMHPDD